MSGQTDDLDQADEEILTYDASDEALEAAAGTERPAASVLNLSFNLFFDCQC